MADLPLTDISRALDNYFTNLDGGYVPRKDRPNALVYGLLTESRKEIMRLTKGLRLATKSNEADPVLAGSEPAQRNPHD